MVASSMSNSSGFQVKESKELNKDQKLHCGGRFLLFQMLFALLLPHLLLGMLGM